MEILLDLTDNYIYPVKTTYLLKMNIIAVDAMTCECGIEEVVKGSLSALENNDLSIILTGDKEKLKPILKKYSIDFNIIENDTLNYDKNNKTKIPDKSIISDIRKASEDSRISIFHAEDIIDMHEKPWLVRTKKDSSIVRAMYLLKNDAADAVVSAGNSGATAAAAYIYVGLIESLKKRQKKKEKRPSTKVPIVCEVPFLSKEGSCAIADVGANPDCNEHNIAQYALLLTSYLKAAKNIEKPLIAQLTIGEEDYKGSSLDRKAFSLLEKLSDKGAINYLGNKEPDDVLMGEADGYVCDAKTGNIFIKTAEAFCKLRYPKEDETSAESHNLSNISANLCEKYGGSLCLGINKPVIITHGRSNADYLHHSIMFANRCAEVIEEVNLKSNELLQTYMPMLTKWYSLLLSVK